MTRLPATIAALSVALIAAKPTDIPVNQPEENHRVVNGEDALEGQYPWVVALDALVRFGAPLKKQLWSATFSCVNSLLDSSAAWISGTYHCWLAAITA